MTLSQGKQTKLEAGSPGMWLPQPQPPKPLESLDQPWESLAQSTPARLAVGRTGTRPLTSTMLSLRLDHAAAIDSVYGEVSGELLKEMGFFSVRTTCADKEDYLRRPDKGRVFAPDAEALIAAQCIARPQVQIVVSDGLSAEAVEANIREVYPALLESLRAQGLTWGTTFFVQMGRVACLNAIGRLLQPEAAVILIGERPGLVTAASMSAYMGYRPRMGMLESDRNVISNIHQGGTPPAEAGALIASRLKAMVEQQVSGVGLVTAKPTGLLAEG